MAGTIASTKGTQAAGLVASTGPRKVNSVAISNYSSLERVRRDFGQAKRGDRFLENTWAAQSSSPRAPRSFSETTFSGLTEWASTPA